MIASTVPILKIPPELLERWMAFVRDACDGSVTVHHKDGNIMSWEIRETGRPDCPKR